MGRQINRLMAVFGMGLLAACSSQSDVADDVGVTADQPTPPDTPNTGGDGESLAEVERRTESSFKAANFTDEETRGGGTREFEYSWPAQVSAIPELARHLQQERTTDLAAQKSDWQQTLTEFVDEDCTSCKSNSYARKWEVVADLPRFLSLSASQYVYGGGAHGNYWFGSLVWDRESKEVIDPRALFTSAAALNDAVRAPYCAALDVERAERRGENDAGFFNDCPDLNDLTLIIGSSDGKVLNRLGLLAAPYVAGPFVEGSYEVTLPVTKAVLDAVKPKYRAEFAAK